LAKEKAYDETCAQLVLVKEGTFHIPVTKDEDGDDENSVTIEYPIMIIGAGQERTAIYGGFQIQGPQKEKKRVNMQSMTMKGSSGSGLSGSFGLSFLCDSMTFTQCGNCGVFANNTKGRLINCVITQCEGSGISCLGNALIELEGDQTKVDGNAKMVGSGLKTSDTSSKIHLLFPLTKESVSTNNHSGRNYNTNGTIKTVDALESL